MKPSLFLLLAVPGFASATAQELSGPASSDEPVISVAGFDFYSWEDYVGSDVFRALGLRCGIPSLEERLASASGSPVFRNPSDCSYSLTSIQPQYEPDGGILFEIPVVFHIISNTSGQGNIPSSRCTSNIEILNEDFRALPGTLGAPGTDVRVRFFLATEDPAGNPTTGITRSTNNSWFADSGNYWDTLAWDTNRYMNVYTNQASGALGYVPDLPQGGIAGQTRDRVVILYSALGRNAPIGPPYNQGRTLTHEVGHYLGLNHTFNGGCGTASCYTTGDLICDTNPESSPTFGCPAGKATCGSPDPLHNYMDYSDDTCYWEFTPEQANRMRCSLENYRPDLAQDMSLCSGTASSVHRNGGSNPDVFESTLPIVGGLHRKTVTTDPYASAIILGYSGSANMTLSGGQTALIDLSSAKLFQFGPVAGPKVTVDNIIPADVAFCEVSFTMQAVLFGGVTPFAMTNALDQTIGNAP